MKLLGLISNFLLYTFLFSFPLTQSASAATPIKTDTGTPKISGECIVKFKSGSMSSTASSVAECLTFCKEIERKNTGKLEGACSYKNGAIYGWIKKETPEPKKSDPFPTNEVEAKKQVDAAKTAGETSTTTRFVQKSDPISTDPTTITGTKPAEVKKEASDPKKSDPFPINEAEAKKQVDAAKTKSKGSATTPLVQKNAPTTTGTKKIVGTKTTSANCSVKFSSGATIASSVATSDACFSYCKEIEKKNPKQPEGNCSFQEKSIYAWPKVFIEPFPFNENEGTRNSPAYTKNDSESACAGKDNDQPKASAFLKVSNDEIKKLEQVETALKEQSQLFEKVIINKYDPEKLGNAYCRGNMIGQPKYDRFHAMMDLAKKNGGGICKEDFESISASNCIQSADQDFAEKSKISKKNLANLINGNQRISQKFEAIDGELKKLGDDACASAFSKREVKEMHSGRCMPQPKALKKSSGSLDPLTAGAIPAQNYVTSFQENFCNESAAHDELELGDKNYRYDFDKKSFGVMASPAYQSCMKKACESAIEDDADFNSVDCNTIIMTAKSEPPIFPKAASNTPVKASAPSKGKSTAAKAQ